jgi:hypothetical protein
MPSLAQTLPQNDIGFVRIIASLWGIELESTDSAQAAEELAETICDADLLAEVVESLPEGGQAALDALVDEGGRIAWVAFARRFGEIRTMGAGKRDREKPHLSPTSAAEMLWYRALLARAFFDTPKGSQEFAFIPDDLREALEFIGFKPAAAAPAPELEYAPDEETSVDEEEAIETATPVAVRVSVPAAETAGLGRVASPAEKSIPLSATDEILDDATTLLAALRMGMECPPLATPAPLLNALLAASRLIVAGYPQPEPIKTFLEQPRPASLRALYVAWADSAEIDDLRLLPGLKFEGGWTNDPLETRRVLLGFLELIPPGQWWSLLAWMRDIKAQHPDFQRPAGDYDSWFIQREADGVFLRGFANWDDVEGALIRQFIQTLHWLGAVDVAFATEGGAITAFRRQTKDEGRPTEAVSSGLRTPSSVGLTVSSDGKISVPRLVARAARYQIARFCEWEEARSGEYRYRVTVNSLTRAREQGLKPAALLSLLQKNASAPIPPPFVRALQRWELNGTEARLESVTILKVKRPEVMEELKKSKAARFLGEVLGPTTVTIQPGAKGKVFAALAEMGLLTDSVADSRKETEV